MTATYNATVTREGTAWLAQADNLPEAHTWAPTLAALRTAIADAIALADDLDDAVTPLVLLSADSSLPSEVANAIEVGNRRARLRAAEAELRADTLATVHDLLQAGCTVRDTAGAVGLTPGRITQIA